MMEVRGSVRCRLLCLDEEADLIHLGVARGGIDT